MNFVFWLSLESFLEFRSSFKGRGDGALLLLPFCRVAHRLICRTAINPSPSLGVRFAMQLIHALCTEGIVVHSPMRLHRCVSASVVRIVVVPTTLFEIVTLVIGERVRLLPAWATLLVTKVEPASAFCCQCSRILPVCMRWPVLSLVTLEKDEDGDGTCYTEQTKTNNKCKEA